MRGRALWIVIACFACQTGLMYGYLFAPLAIPVTEDLGWTRTTYQGAVSFRIPITALFTTLVGFATVRYGPRIVLVSALTVGGVTYAALSRIQDPLHLWLCIPFVGFALAGLGDVPVGHVVTRWLRERRGLALGIVYAGSNVGGFIAVRLAAGIADAWSWREAFLWLGVGGAVLLLPFAFSLREARDPAGEEEESGDAATAADLTLRQAARTRSFWLLLVNLFATFFYFVAMTDQLASILADSGIERTAAAGYFSNVLLVGMFTKIGLGLLADRISAPRALQFNTGLLTMSSFLLFIVDDASSLWLFIATYGFASTARDVLYPLIVAHCFGSRHLAEIYGVLMLTLMAGALGPLVATQSLDRLGGYDMAFAIYAGVNIVSLFAVSQVRRES